MGVTYGFVDYPSVIPLCMNPTDFTFETLRDLQFGRASPVTSLAYWIGVLADPTARFARDASFACDVMCFQYDVEEHGWGYDLTDSVAAWPRLQELMADFGFVYFARKPRGA